MRARWAGAIALLALALLGCEQCPGGLAPITTQLVVCDERTGRCEERESTGCPCPDELRSSCYFPSIDVPQCRPVSGSAWTRQALSLANEHVIDGAFTGDEWEGATRVEGLFTDVYVDFRGGRLYFLNDWRANVHGIGPACCNYFVLGVGEEQLELRVYGNGEVEVRRDGVVIEHDAEGAYGFGPSPRVAEPHTIYEFSIALEGDEVHVCCFDPLTLSSCSVLAREPMMVSVRTPNGGGVEVRRSVPDGSTRRLRRRDPCGRREGICEDGLTCEPVADGWECTGGEPEPDAGVPDFDAGPPG